MLNFEEIISILSRYRERLQTEFGVRRIGVFGSYARGEQTQESDIDFIVDFADDLMDIFETKYQLRRFLSEIFNKQIDLANYKSIKPYVLENISREIKFA